MIRIAAWRQRRRRQSWDGRSSRTPSGTSLLLERAGRDQPDRRRAGRGQIFLGLRRQSLSRLCVAARQRLDRPLASEGDPGDQGSGRQARHDRAADGDRVALPAREAAGRGDAGRSDDVVLHERRRRGQRERDQAGALVHRAPQGDRALSQLSRRNGGRDHADRRPAAVAGRTRLARRGAHVRPLHLPLPGRAAPPVPGVLGRARIWRRSSSTRAHTPSPR